MISQFPSPATCCLASLAVKDSPSETVSSNKLFSKLLLVVVFYHSNKVTPAEVGTREWAAAVRNRTCCVLKECGRSENFGLEKHLEIEIGT